MKYAIFSLVAFILPGLACGADRPTVHPKSTKAQTPIKGQTPKGQIPPAHANTITASDSLSGTQPVAVLIEAWLPGTDQTAKLEAIRQNGPPDREHYEVVKCEGDAIVLADLIGPYLDSRHEFDGDAAPSVLVKPANYTFHYEGKSEAEGSELYTFQVSPKTSDPSLVRGKLWIDSETGLAVVQTRSVARPGTRHPIEFVRTTALSGNEPFARITLASFDTSAGRGYVKVTEISMAVLAKEAPSTSQ